MEQQYVFKPLSGKLVHQLPEGITFAYYLHLGCLRNQ